jgi:predicted transcriptional regulator
MIDRKLFGEPAWDMLLALFFFPWRNELLSVTSLSYAANVPQTTGLRWQRVLTEEGLIHRGPPGIDQRKQYMALTDEGKRLMSDYLTHLFYCDAPIARQVNFEGD